MKQHNNKTSNGKKPNIHISDELDILKRMYTPKQIQKMWEEAYPKPLNPSHCYNLKWGYDKIKVL